MKHRKRLGRTEKIILYYLCKYGDLSTGELSKHAELDDETVLINCNMLIKKALILPKKNKHGKYSINKEAKELLSGLHVPVPEFY